MTDAIRLTDWWTIARPRTFVYAAVWALIGIALVLALALRERLDVNVLRDRNPIYVVLSDGSIRNGYDVKILNMRPEPRSFRIGIDGLPGASMKQAGSDADAAPVIEVAVKPDQLRAVKLFVRVPAASAGSGERTFRFVVTDVESHDETSYTARFGAPK